MSYGMQDPTSPRARSLRAVAELQKKLLRSQPWGRIRHCMRAAADELDEANRFEMAKLLREELNRLPVDCD